MTEQHFPTHGGSYIVGKDGIIRTEAEAATAEASKILPKTELESTEPAPAATKSKGI
jgi:hypothetical protein